MTLPTTGGCSVELHEALDRASPDANGITHAMGYGATRRRYRRLIAHRLPNGKVCIPGRISTALGPRVWTWIRRVDWLPVIVR